MCSCREGRVEGVGLVACVIFEVALVVPAPVAGVTWGCGYRTVDDARLTRHWHQAREFDDNSESVIVY